MAKDKSSKRELILETAFTLFLEKGYSETKIIDIADAASIGKGTVYEYFDSKEKLFLELFKCKVANSYLNLPSLLDKEISCEEKIKEFIDFEFKITSKFGIYKNLHLEILMKTGAFQNPDLIKAIHELIGFKFSILYQIIEEGINKSEFIKVDPLMASTAILGAVNFFLSFNCNMMISIGNLPLDIKTPWDKAEFYNLIFKGLKP